MAATTTRQSGVDFVILEGSTAIGGGTDATLTVSVDAIDTTNKGSARWTENLSGVRGWSMDFENLFLESTAEIAGSGATLDIDGYDLPGLKSYTASFSADAIDATDEDASLDRTYLPGDRGMSVDFEANFFEPAAAGNNAVQTLIDAANGDATNSMTLTLTFGAGQSIAATARVTNLEINAPSADVVTLSGTLVSTGSVTITDTNADAQWVNLVTDFETATQTTANVVFTNETTDDTQYAGTAYMTAFAITVPFDGAVSISGTLTGTGTLNDSVIV